MIRCGIYLRISREDGAGESDSIGNQRKLLQSFLQDRPDMELVREWVDDGKTGSNYDRPGFQSMIQWAARGEIDCLICKDLSRLGREYILLGHYLQEIFPKMGLRVIAVADHYDSDVSDFMEQSLLFPVINLMNDAYCRDISGKVRWQQKTRRQRGDYIGAFPCYGYRKRRENIHELVVDEGVRDIVKGIYFLSLSGMAAESIASVLNQGQILSPRSYKASQGSHFRSGFDGQGPKLWSPLSVRRILSNPMYTGVMVQGKDTKISYKLKIRKKLPPQEWIQVPGKVPVLIPSWVAQRVAQQKKKRIRCRRGKVYCELFAGYSLENVFGERTPLSKQSGEAKGKLWREIYRIIEKKCSVEWNQSGTEQLPGEKWERRLFLSLLVRDITLDMERKGIFLDFAARR